VDSELILDSPWPADLDPATVPFKTRTQTVLHRAGLHDDPTRLDTNRSTMAPTRHPLPWPLWISTMLKQSLLGTRRTTTTSTTTATWSGCICHPSSNT
jgi:hypothetical protein